MTDKDAGRVSPSPSESACAKELTLAEIFLMLWPFRWRIVLLAIMCGIIGLAATFFMPTLYRADVLLSPIADKDNRSGLSSALGAFGRLPLAGVSLQGPGGVKEHLAVLRSKEFVLRFIRDKDLKRVLFDDEWNEQDKVWLQGEEPSDWDAYRCFVNDILRISSDSNDVLITVSVIWTDPEQAQSWANGLVRRLNDYLRAIAIQRSQKNLHYLNEALEQTQVEEMRETLFSLIVEEQKKAMLANTQEDFAFRVLDKALAPDKKISPQRGEVAFAATLGGLLAGLVGFLLRGLFLRAFAVSEAPSKTP